MILAVVKLDPFNVQSGWVDLDLSALGITAAAPASASFAVRDLLTGNSFQWSGSRNFVQLPFEDFPAHVFVVENSI